MKVQETHVINLIDVSDDDSATDSRKRSRESSFELRRTHRKTEGRVFYGEVMAQEREMERIHYEMSRQHQSAPMQLRKSEMVESSINRMKQKRAEKRRSARQKFRRNMSPRSPEGGPQLPVRGGVSLVNLEGEDAPLEHKRRFVRDEDAIQDASLHSTAWRNVKLKDAPKNFLPDREGILQPFACEMNAALDNFNEDFKSKCQVLIGFLKPKSMTMTFGTLEEARDVVVQMDNRVRQVIDEAIPLVKKYHAARVKTIIANARQQIATYLEDRPVVHAKTMATIVGLPLQISRLEKVAARRLLRNCELVLNDENRPHYSVARNESGYSENVYPRVVIHLRKIPSVPRSTTCVLACGAHRVEDDPIIRFVPYFSAESNARSKEPLVSIMDPCKDALFGLDDEVREFVLRYTVNACGCDQSVFDALQRTGTFMQPFANYADICDRVTREKLYKRHLRDLEVQQNSDNLSAHRKRVLAIILDKCRELQVGTHLRGRLEPLPLHLVLNYLQRGEELGLRDVSSEQYRELVTKYQDFFCRRCCVYSCRNHGREQPVPIVRVDPQYPVVKGAINLWRQIENEQLPSIEDSDVDTDGEEIIEGDEPMQVMMATTNSSVNEEMQQACDVASTVGGESTRRSVRAQTAASTKASSKLNADRVHIKELVRSKTADVSEYLGLDGVYQTITQDKKLELFSVGNRCGSHCSKLQRQTIQRDEPHGFSSTIQVKPWRGSEIALLKKLADCVGLNTCVLAVLIATRSCTDVADFFQKCKRITQGDLEELVLLQNGGRHRERSNGVYGNHYEHLYRTRSQRMKDRGANHEYVPCNHSGGSCDSALCSCMRRDHYCEKSCGCSPDCSNRFPGCHCEEGQCRTSKCPCYFAARECDPDICTSCGASELPVVMAAGESKSQTIAQLKICGNVNILRGKMCKIGVSTSATHGWGAYALENVKKGKFMYEYTGSLLSQDEAERRGNVYDKMTISFLFDLTEDTVVDATRKGNKSKFANHSSTEPKCFARIMHVNGDHRIGIYAKEDIVAGEELFFDYGYSGVIPDWSQARIGSSKDTTPTEEDDDTKANVVDAKEEHKS
ncbi:unnamed protein product [Peronospora belbahrii]|uniref:SET domain-containing protein n=1 Tax=Peronospora belbahrii TaxID=622444 RepID=A0AAU9KNY1_9STRA|nr:unnamed protein product [Peronospora belbahrii]